MRQKVGLFAALAVVLQDIVLHAEGDLGVEDVCELLRLPHEQGVLVLGLFVYVGQVNDVGCYLQKHVQVLDLEHVARDVHFVEDEVVARVHLAEVLDEVDDLVQVHVVADLFVLHYQHLDLLWSER